MLLFLISGALALYFGRDPHETALRTYLVQNRVGQAANADATKVLEPSIEKLASRAGSDEKAALYYFVMKYEKSEELDRRSLQVLKSSTDARRRAVARIYESSKLTPQEAKRLTRILDEEDDVVYTLPAHYAREKAGLVKPEEPGSGSTAPMMLAGLGMLAAMGMGVLIWIGFIAMRASGHFRERGSPAGILSPANSDRYALRCFQVFLVFLGVSLVFGLTRADIFLGEWSGIVTFGTVLLFNLAILPVLPVGGKFITLRRLGIDSDDLGTNVLWGLAGALAAFPLALLALLMSLLFPGLPPPEHPVTIEMRESETWLSVLTLFFMGAVVAPIWEELCFRGLMLPAMASLFRSAVIGILVSSFCFAAIHPTGIPAWPTLAGVGAISAYLTYQRRSLVPSIVMHAIYNFTLLLVMLAAS